MQIIYRKDFNEETFFYHNICKMSIINKCKTIEKETPTTDWHTYCRYHELALDELSEIIVENFLTAKRSFLVCHTLILYT